MTNYFVRESDGRSTRPVAWGGETALLVVIKEGQTYLPHRPSDLVVLHKMHANKSERMWWDNESHAFACRHCSTKVNMSESSFLKIQESYSTDCFSSFRTGDGVGIEFGFLCDGFDPIPAKPGIYVVLTVPTVT